MTRRLSHRHLAAPAAALGAATLAFTVLAQPAPATTHTIDEGHWDLLAEVDCSNGGTIALKAENHEAETTRDLREVVFVVEAPTGNSVTPKSNDTGRFTSPDELRVLTDDEAEALNGELVLGFGAEYVNCGSTPPAATFFVDASASTVPTGDRVAAYEDTSGTDTDLDTATGTNLNEGVTTSGHVDRRWGFSDTESYVVNVVAEVTINGQPRSVDENVSFSVS